MFTSEHKSVSSVPNFLEKEQRHRWPGRGGGEVCRAMFPQVVEAAEG
jgi:hypothetical protein